MRNPDTRGTPVRCSFQSPLGAMTLATTDKGLAGIWFDGQKHMPDTRTWPVNDTHPVLLQAQTELREYFAGKRNAFDLPLDLNQGTVFQQQVWRGLLE
ncbi:MAG: cysteine methyltransferase, partial [Rhodoferax sp.]|nr:cysteine methyltransferase [Rhodoferax sp.]